MKHVRIKLILFEKMYRAMFLIGQNMINPDDPDNSIPKVRLNL